MRVAFYTLGCKLNQSESEALASTFKSRGFFITRPQDGADIFIVNSCTVTSKAEQKARRMIRKLARNNPDAVIIVTGCYAQLDREVIEALVPNVVVLGHDRKYQLLDLAQCLEMSEGCSAEASVEAVQAAVEHCVTGFKSDAPEEGGIFRFAADTYSFHSRAFLKVQDGCDHKCAYCRVRLARGPSVSLGPDEVAARAAQLYRRGYNELVLTGVNLTAYRDPDNRRFGLPQLLNQLTAGPEDYRIRLSSLEPEMIRSDLIEAVRHARVCPHFHIPVQSGSDRLLKMVHRPYSADRIRQAVADLRSAKDDPFLAADVIVGLPGETDEDFQATYELIKECGFSALHIFTYSPRPGTELYNAKNPVPERIAGERAEALRELAAGLESTYAERWIGREVRVLLEEIHMIGDEEYWGGLSENYLRVEIPIDFFPAATLPSSLSGTTDSRGETKRAAPGMHGEVFTVRIESVEEHIFGRLEY
ncbi:MAG: tRNA (N(6)-L-threonylcarbamoyladenosine(37)-C(2))-methylthiotransferase MtaB [Spirochaetia bacterium]